MNSNYKSDMSAVLHWAEAVLACERFYIQMVHTTSIQRAEVFWHLFDEGTK